MVNYNNSRIYKIVDNTNNNIYIGSTTKTLSQRLAKHRSHYNDFLKDRGNYMTSFDILQNGNYDIVLLEEVKCENKEQLHQRERHYIEALVCVNKFIPCRTSKEYMEEYAILNKDKMSKQRKEYRENNKEIIAERNKQYRIANADKIKKQREVYIEVNIEKVKQTRKLNYENNKEIILNKRKECYENNKNKIKEEYTKKFTCDCGSIYTLYHKARHFKTNKHIEFIKNI
jgi:hypothetical protein